MLRPERMSKVSITGARSVMEEAIAVLHDLELMHLEEYDERWEGFRTGDPLESAESASEWLVTIRALQNTLKVDPAEVHPEMVESREVAADRLEEVRTAVTGLEDERTELMDEIRELNEELDRLEPLATLGIDLDLLQGYETVEVVVGKGQSSAIDQALSESNTIEAHELIEKDGVIAIVARATDGQASAISDALVGVELARLEIPEGSGDPASRRDEINHRLRQLEHDRERTNAELESIRLEHGGFLVTLEEELSIDVERAEAPIRFATTEHAFIAEGWVPTKRVPELESQMATVVGDAIEVDELEQMAYEPPHHHEATADGGDDLELHGNHPPVIQQNPSIVKPFEVFVQTINRPRYHELDPTIFVFLTFPFAFGFMIGDIGYGLLYMAMGWAVIRYTDSEGMWALGMIAVWAGIFTILFGYLYDDIFGIHMADLNLALPLAGTLDKGLQITEVAQLWIIFSILFGVIHLGVGYAIGFLNHLHHGIGEAFSESGSWLVVLIGLFAWIFTTESAGTAEWLPGEVDLLVTKIDLAGTDWTASVIKPEFLVGPESVLASNYMFDLGFEGFSETVAVVGLVLIIVGWAFAIKAEGFIAVIELPTNAFGHAVSYLRMMAVLLAKGGMAFVVNLIVFGGYEQTRTISGQEIDYVFFHLPGMGMPDGEAVFQGLVWMDPLVVTIPLAIFVFVFGHIVVLLLGITAAGIQMTRLELVEFFGKFYDGGGGRFEPFGYKRRHTEEH